MMATMRRALVWLLLALLPWRLWAADAMALQPCHAPTPSVVTPLASPDHTASHHALHAEEPAYDAARHAAHTPSDGSAAPDSTQSPHAGCTLCDICHNTAMAAPATAAFGNPVPHRWGLTQAHLPPTPAMAPPHKPPIA